MDWNRAISTFIGSVPAIIALFGSVAYMDRKITIWMIEHEVLIADWQKRNPDQVLPTRTNR